MGLPLIRQPLQTAVQQLKCDQIFTWPSDQPRHAATTPQFTRSKPDRPLLKTLGKLHQQHNYIVKDQRQTRIRFLLQNRGASWIGKTRIYFGTCSSVAAP